ncbi:hypothetical protein JTB14_030350 [Gonioctena quinquepunctata]|nr:hypothetical protein JTB14_030350 [Gonioctena quinquepunctata]
MYLKKKFKIKGLGPVNNFLGIRQTRESGVICLDQERYIEDVLRRFKFEECKAAKTPLDVRSHLTLSNQEEMEEAADLPYLALIGALMYLALL